MGKIWQVGFWWAGVSTVLQLLLPNAMEACETCRIRSMLNKDQQTNFVRLPPTQWSLVFAARDPSSSEGAEALGNLCQLYYYPLYAFVRRRGYAPEDAEDLIQEFFCRVLNKKYLGQAEETRGRFRTFLLTAVRHFLANEWDHRCARKRGGDRRHVSLEGMDSESRYAAEPVDSITPDRLYDRAWAMTVLERVMQSMRQRFAVNGAVDEELRIMVSSLRGPGG